MMTADRFIHYKLGNDLLDKEHWDLCRQFDIVANNFRRSEYDQAGKNLKKLIDTSTIHFQTEEVMMVTANYKFIDSHRAEHIRLLDILTRLGNMTRTRENTKFINELSHLFEDHIDHYDRQFDFL